MKIVPIVCVFLCMIQRIACEGLGVILTVDAGADRFLKSFSDFMQSNNLDPHALLDSQEELRYRPFFLEYVGRLKLSEGLVEGLSNMRRHGEVQVTMGQKAVIQLPIHFPLIKFHFKYEATIWNIGPAGGVNGNIYDAQVRLLVDVDLTTYEVHLRSFEVASAGLINVKFDGHILWDWAVTLFSRVLTTFFHDELIRLFQSEVTGQVKFYFADLNHYTMLNRDTVKQIVGQLVAQLNE